MSDISVLYEIKYYMTKVSGSCSAAVCIVYIANYFRHNIGHKWTVDSAKKTIHKFVIEGVLKAEVLAWFDRLVKEIR